MLDTAVAILKNEDIVSIPTETVYGLAGSIYSEKALKKIFSVKNRPFFDPLIIHISSIEEAKKLVKNWHPAIQLIAENFWPGPLTLVLDKNLNVSNLITSGLPTVALRMPNHPIALELIKKCGFPLAAPSANKFGKTSPTTAQHVRDEFGEENIQVVDGGACSVGLESTVLSVGILDDITINVSILRKGFVKINDIASILEKNNFKFKIILSVDVTNSPGHMKHHYMPKKPLIILDGVGLDKLSLKSIKLKLDDLPSVIENISINKPQKIEKFKELSLSSNPVWAARELYSKLRESSLGDEDIIIFQMEKIHQQEAWDAVLERLLKAATLIIE